MYKDEEIEKFLENLDIVQVIGEYVTLKKAGANYKGFSPFKEERTPSFTVSPTKNIFKDFSTGIGGNAISFYMKINNITFYEAIEELSAKYNVPIRKLNISKKSSFQNEKYYEIMREAQEIFSNNILKSEQALRYMENRGFSLEEIKKYGIGFSFDTWDSLLNALREKGYSEEDMLELGLVRKNERGNVFDYFRNRIMFPIYNETMKPVGFGGRIITSNDNSPKYLNSPDSKIFKKGNELFGLYNRGENIRKKGLAILMEGYLDVLSAHKNNFSNAVASLGTSFTEGQAKLLKKYTNNIIIAYDNDNAGKEAVLKAANILKKDDFNIRCLSIEGEVKDPDEYLRKYGRKNFLEILKTSKGIFDFLFDEFSKELNLNEITGKRKMIERFRNFFSNVTNNTEKNLYASKLSVELGIDKEVLMGELGNFSTAQKKSKKYLKKEEKVLSKAKKDEFYNSLEIETLKFLLKFKNNLSSEEQEHCEKFDDKVFENVIYKDIMEKLKTINFEITKLDSLTLEEEERELITTMKLKAEADIENEGRHYKDIFVGWFLREIDHMREIIDRKDKMYVILRRLESELKIIHNIEEIEKMYKEFKLIRRSDYV